MSPVVESSTGSRDGRREANERRDAGSVMVEIVVLTPLLVMIAVFVVFLGRATGATEQVRHAADEGARAASLVSRPSMSAVAQSVALTDLQSNGVNCASTNVAVGIANGSRVSSVTVTVTCNVNGQGTSLLGAKARSVTASSTEVIDRYRSN